MTILVTGGAGYIGSHACVELASHGEDILLLDNFSNSHPSVPRRLEKILGRSLHTARLDIRDSAGLDKLFAEHHISAVMHFAGLKAVAESVSDPLLYYRNNVEGTLVLLDAMSRAGVRDIIFSSSATVYGDPDRCPVPETAAIRPTNPYGQGKAMIENILMDMAHAPGSGWRVALLRYFNPVGAHASGQIGEDPTGIPNNLLPYIARVATGSLGQLSIYGDDYPTRDGTGVRDYIHVVDLAAGHRKARDWLRLQKAGCCEVFNLGTGTGYSVLEVISAFEKSSGVTIARRVTARRAGDVAESYADAGKAARELDWKATRSLDDMMRDAWNWQKNNPSGYRS